MHTESRNGKSTRVTVCMAVYNGAAYLRPQVASILPQLSSEDELVIVDDCSTDATRRILEEFVDPRIRVVRQSINKGALRTFERALKDAIGDIIFFSDQDDVWLPGKVERTKELFSHTGALAIVTDAVVVGAEEEVMHRSYFVWRQSGPGLLKNFYKSSFVGCCMAIRRECKEFLLPFPPLAVMHDVWAGLACEVAGGTYFLPEQLVMYRRHGASYTRMKRYPWPRVVYRRLALLLSLLQRLPRIIVWRLRRRRENEHI